MIATDPLNTCKNNFDGMTQALAEARKAAVAGEVPVGAVVVKDGQIIARAHNHPLTEHDPCGHAEIVALRAAGRSLGNYRLDGCIVYVTLEPCAMCAGALINARVSQVVFGAAEPKTGAAGSVIDLFANAQLNAHTAVQGGVMAQASADLLACFFKQQRHHHREVTRMTQSHLRTDALRTDDTRFADLPGYPWPPHYVSDLPSLDGLRMHYLDVPGQGASPAASSGTTSAITYLCLHGNPTWSYLYRKMIPIFTAHGHRVVAPDLIGFGKSDKPKKDSAHQFDWHRQTLLELIERLDLQRIVLVVQDWGGLLGLTLPMAAPERYIGLLVMNTFLATGEPPFAPLSPGFIAWRDMCAKNPAFDIARLMARSNPHLSPTEAAAYMAPFPTPGHRAATRAFPALVPEFPHSPGAATSRQAQAFWQTQWTGQTFMAIGQQDPVLGEPVMQALRATINHCPAPMLLPQAGHFVQEHGEDIARAAVNGYNFALRADTRWL
jgi:tRNA(adenine34) deaminase